jgi:hypothetical protein
MAKASKRKTLAGELTRRDRLLEELQGAAASVDEEGLVFLIEQANALLHNARVRELESRRRGESGSPVRGKAGPGGAGPDATKVGIEETKDGASFFLVLGSVRKALSRAELREIARICQAASPETLAAARLYALLERERRDILGDAGIRGPDHPLLVKLAGHVRAHYRPRGSAGPRPA